MSVSNRFRCIAAADDGRDAELAGNDGCMTRAAAAIGHDGCCSLHHGLPVRVCHIRDEHIPGLHEIHLPRIVDDSGRPLADALTDTSAARKDAARLFE